MRRSLVLFGGLALTAAVFFGIGKVWPAVHEEPTLEVMPERWAQLQHLPSKPLAKGLVTVGEGRPTQTAQWFLHPEKLKGTPMVGADAVVDAKDLEAVGRLMKRVKLLAVSGQVPLDGVWKYEGGAWQKVELERAVQEAIDDVAYNYEGQLFKDAHVVERDHSGEHSVVTVTKEGDLLPPAERVAFKERGAAAWEDVLEKAPGVLEREPGTVLEWYRLKRFPTPDELTALTATR
jgi:hypothetical protein